MKNFFKKLLVWNLVLMMVFSTPIEIFAQVNYNDLTKDKSEIINKLDPVKPAKLEEGQSAADLVKNPEQPKIYTLRTDYKVQRGDKYEINYQPYIASVGDAATQAEKDKVNKKITLPELAGYDKSHLDDTYKIDYETVKNAAEGKNESGNDANGKRYQANEDLRYKAKANEITIKHVFQDLHDFTKYTNPDGSVGDDTALFTTQSGNTGSTMEVSPLDGKHPNRKGFVPEAPFITMQVPENAENFILEYRYNRAHYDVKFDIKGGTPVPSRTLYYEQTIPKIDDTSIPKKAGSDFLGWMPSITLKTTGGKTYPENQIIKDSNDKPILNLDADLKMPASKITFTAVWQEKDKAEYVIQFWTEKTDYDDKDDKLPLRDRYDFIGARRIDDADTGSRPDLTNLDIHGITFPDLNDGRLEKAQDDKKEFERYYFLNEDLTKKQNASEKDPNVQKSVSSTGETVYNVYYNRRVYTLYFTAANELAFENAGSFWPIITRDGQIIGQEGSPYKVDVRFNQSLNKIWPKDAEVSNLPPASSKPDGDTGLIGWIINNNAGETIFRDTPPYRLSAEDFIDAEDVMSEEDYYGYGHADEIPIKDGQTKTRDKYEISLGSTSLDTAVVHHIDIIKDDFDGKEQIDYEMSYWKSDTNAVDYDFILPHLQGFTLKEETRKAEWVLKEPDEHSEYRTIDDLNNARNEKTPFRSDADKIKYIDKFPWGTKLFDGKNAYNYANYTRNKYKLKLNDDPKTVKNDSEYGESNILDVPYELPLNDLKLDTTHKPEKPNWVRDDWSFLGWALDPAGDNLVKDGNETKLHYDQILYAKWGEPDYKWKVIFDPNGGSLRTIDENKLTTELKTVKEGDIGQEKETTYPIKEANQAGKQVFTVIQKQKLIEPKFKPVRKGYDFMGWEIIRYKKNEQGDYTEEIDNSYRETYKVPELYSFGNEVVSPIYLKAIWVPNARVDIDVLHYYLDKDYNLDTNISPNPDPAKLENKRAGYLVATTGDRQDDKYTLVPHDELNEKLTGDLKTIYEEYNTRVGLNNSFFQTFRVEPEKIDDGNGNLIDNPNLKNNVFKFFYRPYRQREYKVNYIDESFRGKENEKDGAIIDQELVENGNRHYDARNYRPIPGWVLTSPPQQQLFFDLNEETNEFLGINGTGKDEITFYYKDVRVIEVPKDGKTPDGYVRVTFKADKGGSFGKDAQGKDITELNYDVIKGLKSDLLPVPKELADGETVDKDKHYITPETGRKFTKWDNSPLLNANTIINNNHTFTAYFEWSGLSASGLVRTEAFKDPKGTWTNDFAPKIEDLKKQLVWREKDVVKPLPDGTEIKFFDEDGKELTTDEDVFKLVNEQNKADKDELVRTVNIKAKATFKDGTEAQELEIPVKIYKNVYEALTGTAKPLFLKDAESSDLKDITGEYVKVTVAPTGDMNSKDNKVYYVNPKAWVSIPEVKADGSSSFINWTANKAAQNEGQAENGIFDFTKRHKFTEDTIISPVGAEDVVEQKQGEDKPKVPDTFVKVIVKTTDKATDTTAFEKTFWVNPTKEVTIDVINPTGKTITTDTTKYTMKFSKWENKEKDRTWEDKIVGKFVKDTTIIAKYSIKAEIIKELLPTTDKVHTPQGKTPTVDEIKEKITPPEGKTIKTVTIVENPKVDEPGESKVKVIIEYTDGSKVGTNEKPVEVPVEVHKNIIPEEKPGKRPDGALENYVKVIFKAGEGGSLSGNLVYYVSPEVEVDMSKSADSITKTPNIGYINGAWDTNESKKLKAKFTAKETEFTFNFKKSADIVEKTDDPNQEIPKGYVKVTFKTEDANKGKLEGDKEVKVYYVNPKAGIKLKVLEEGQTAGEKELKVPETLPAKNYVFDKWQESIDEENPITDEKIHVAMFQAGQVTLTYNKGGADVTGDLPANVTAKYGETVVLAGAGNLTKPNAKFAGWKLDEDEKIYQPGDQVTLEKARTATAQWTTSKHKVTFKSMGGSDVDSQEVVHQGKLKEFTPPTKDGKVFMGWKEKGKESEEAYFDLTSPITEDKTLIAFWQDPVQKINENDPVEKEFIKVTFKKGKHGDLDGQTTYKVAKDLSFEEAVKKGLKVPTISPAKYYKAVEDNKGWDQTLELKGKDITFIAQYEPIADVIPVDPDVTDETQIENEKPEEMVLVTFKVSDDDKLYIPNNDKYYVKKNTEVRIPTPVVLKKTNDAVFNGWQEVTLVEETLDPDDTDPKAEKFIWVKQAFSEDTIISDENTEEIELKITKPLAGETRIYIKQMSADSTANLELIRDGEVIESVSNKIFTRRRIEYNVFDLTIPVQSGDTIRYWQESPSRISDYITEIID